jgi:hypothetical protein
MLLLLLRVLQGAKRLYEEFMRPFLYSNAKKIDPVFRGTQAVSWPCFRMKSQA